VHGLGPSANHIRPWRPPPNGWEPHFRPPILPHSTGFEVKISTKIISTEGFFSSGGGSAEISQFHAFCSLQIEGEFFFAFLSSLGGHRRIFKFCQTIQKGLEVICEMKLLYEIKSEKGDLEL